MQKTKQILTADFLIQEYKINKKTKHQISREINISVSTINRYLKNYSIENNLPVSKIKNLTGKRFFKLFVLRQDGSDRHGKSLWLCKCDCGKIKTIHGSSLKRNLTKSCGCDRKEMCFKGYKDISGVFWNKLIKGAISRNLEFNITPEYVWELFLQQNARCAYSNVPIKLYQNADKDTLRTASLDRIDSDKGYIKGNIHWVHKKINILKNNFSNDEFVWWMQQVSSRFSTKENKDYENTIKKRKFQYYED